METFEKSQTVDATSHCNQFTSPCKRTPYDRRAVAENLERFRELDSPTTSCAQIARRLEVPERTLSYWVRRQRARIRRGPCPEKVVQFFDSPEGVDVLRMLLTAAHLVFVQGNDCGIRNLCSFLKLSRLDHFVASSYGAQRALAEQIESLLVRFGEEEDRRLAASMPPQQITLCEDETFHPQICLVSMEPVSGFLLLEEYQSQRNADTWNRCLDQRLAPLQVTVFQVTSDQAAALISHTEDHLGAHHSPDIFHVQQDTVRATGGGLASQTRATQRAVEESQKKAADLRAKYTACREKRPQDPSLQKLEQRVQRAEAEETETRQRLAACQGRQERAKAARHGLSQDYHPVNLTTSRAQSADEVTKRLTGHFDVLDEIAAEAHLSARACEKLAKARRVLGQMQKTLVFFWTLVSAWLASWRLSESEQRWMREELIPGYYVRRAAEKAQTAEERQRLRALSEEILARARSPDGLWGTLPPEVQADLERKAQCCADIFQRSSSCVEGRNGQLSLSHHALHRLSTRKLQALKVLHNYLLRRRDGTTAAERFYGSRPRELFPWLLEHLSFGARPRAKRHAA
jgi:hypothetical protein